MLTLVWIAVGGAIGTLARHGLNLAVTARFGEHMPWGTIAINVIGSFVIGLFAAVSENSGRFVISPDVRLIVMVGLCGGFTTFSSFSLQTLTLLLSDHPVRAIANVVGSVLLCLLAVWLGHAAPALLHGMRS